MSELGDRIRAEAAISDRPGQMARLEAIAVEVEAYEEAYEFVRDPVVMEDEARAEAARINAWGEYGVDEYSFIAGAEWQVERAIFAKDA